MYGFMIDLTGIVEGPGKLDQGRFNDGTRGKLGAVFHGDGRSYRVTFCAANLRDVKNAARGAELTVKLLRASFFKGK